MTLQPLSPLAILHLSRCFDPFPDAEVDDGEDEQQTERELPAHPSQVVQAIGSVYLKNMAAEREGNERCG